MKLSVYNPTGGRIAIAGGGRFAGIVVRSLFATRGHQLFDVASQEHADWLIHRIKLLCPQAQVAVIPDEAALPVEEAAAVADFTPEKALVPAEETALPVEEAAAASAIEDTKKAAQKKSKTIAETKE